jgi:hypothetical protein
MMTNTPGSFSILVHRRGVFPDVRYPLPVDKNTGIEDIVRDVKFLLDT